MVNFKEIYPEGVQYFPGGVQLFPGGVQLLIPYRDPYNFWFSGGGSGPPVPPSGSALDSVDHEGLWNWGSMYWIHPVINSVTN